MGMSLGNKNKLAVIPEIIIFKDLSNTVYSTV
jgi:hypothetical protein